MLYFFVLQYLLSSSPYLLGSQRFSSPTVHSWTYSTNLRARNFIMAGDRPPIEHASKWVENRNPNLLLPSKSSSVPTSASSARTLSAAAAAVPSLSSSSSSSVKPSIATATSLSRVLDLNSFLLESDPHRHTVPALESAVQCFSFLAINHPIRRALPQMLRVTKEVILRHGISDEDVTFCQYSSLLDPVKLKDHPMVSISAKASGGIESWKLAANELYLRLQEMRIGDPFVEIVCHKKIWDLNIDPILDNQAGFEVKTAWEKVRPEILQLLSNNLSTVKAQWSNICVFMCTRRDLTETKHPTIVISMFYPAIADWGRNTEGISKILSSKGVSTLSIEFTYGSLVFSQPDHEEHLELKDLKDQTRGG